MAYKPFFSNNEETRIAKSYRFPEDLVTVFYDVERHAKKKLRTADQIKATFDRLVRPKIGKLGVNDVRRMQVKEMLDAIETAATTGQRQTLR